MNKIEKGIDKRYGLPAFIINAGHKHDPRTKMIEIYYEYFCETPTGEKCYITTGQRLLVDIPEIMDGDTIITPAVTDYTDNYERFGGTQIDGAIDNFLTTI